jgi:hypothetical protein
MPPFSVFSSDEGGSTFLLNAGLRPRRHNPEQNRLFTAVRTAQVTTKKHSLNTVTRLHGEE